MPKLTKRRRRIILRCCFLAVAVTLALPILPWASTSMIVPAVSPFVAVGSAIALRSFAMIMLIAIPVLVLATFRRRWFCSNACPMGAVLQPLGRVRPKGRRGVSRWPQIGTWIVFLTLAAACLGYPVLLWLDPLALFAAYFGLCWQPPTTLGLIAGLGVPIVVLMSIVWPRSWCRKVCPLGATQELLAVPRRAFATKLDDPPGKATVRRPVPRRSVLAAGLGLVAVAAGAAWGWRAIRRKTRALLRPPGAVDESQFPGLCIRCGNCVRVCPEGILSPAPSEDGVAEFLTPVVSFERQCCLADCSECMKVCPSGAIARLPLSEKPNTRIGIAVVDLDICIMPVAECSICLHSCPYNDDPDNPVLGKYWNNETYEAYPVIDTDRCTGCGACELECRGVILDGPPAMRIVPIERDLDV